MRLSITNTVLIFVVVPLAIIGVIAGLSLAASAGRRARRYRPGRPYEFTPLWFLSSPDSAVSPDPVMQPTGSSAVAGRGHDRAVGAGPAAGGTAVTDTPVARGATGGASDGW